MNSVAVGFLGRRVARPLATTPVRTHFGYVSFEGTIPRRDQPRHRLIDQVQLVNLKPVKKLHFVVDPLHGRSHSIRQAMHLLSSRKVKSTGLKTAFKFEFVSVRRDPRLTVSYHDDAQHRPVVLDTAFLSQLDILYYVNKFTLPLVKEDVETVATKGSATRKN